jgi:predicted nucleic acid-binding protein
VGVVVFDTDVLIAYLSRADAQHGEALERVRAALEEEARVISAANYAELLVGPARQGTDAAVSRVDSMLDRLTVEVVAITRTLARRAADVRASTGLKLPDAFAVATALQSRDVHDSATIESFDSAVTKSFARLAKAA